MTEYLIPILKKNSIPFENLTTHKLITAETGRKVDVNDDEFIRIKDMLKQEYYDKIK